MEQKSIQINSNQNQIYGGQKPQGKTSALSGKVSNSIKTTWTVNK